VDLYIHSTIHLHGVVLSLAQGHLYHYVILHDGLNALKYLRAGSALVPKNFSSVSVIQFY
jgi:hypothetical protein